MWQPYVDDAINAHIPDDVRGERQLWSTVSPLICFEVLEWHAADRVMRQFGFTQHIPLPPQSLEGFHNKDLRGLREPRNWRALHDDWVTLWDHRYHRILQGIPIDNYNPSTEYWEWYTQYAINWLWLSPQMQQPAPQQQHFPMESPPRQ